METPTDAQASRQIPNELIHKILRGVLADSVHTICMSSKDKALNWHYNVVSTLCAVCFSFQEIGRDIAMRVFAIKGEKDSIPRLARDKLQYLRSLGMQYRSPFGHSPESLLPTDGSHLIQGYSLYLTATALRHNALGTQDSGEVFQTAHGLVSKALSMSLRLCGLVQPKGMEDILRRAVLDEITLVQISTSLVEARIDLDVSLDKMAAAVKSSEENKTQQIDCIKTEIHGALQKIEEADERSQDIISSEAAFLPGLKYPILQFPGVLNAVRLCSELTLDLDEYDIVPRAISLFGKWKRLGKHSVQECEDDSFNLAATTVAGRWQSESLWEGE